MQKLSQEKATTTANRIDQFLSDIERQIKLGHASSTQLNNVVLICAASSAVPAIDSLIYRRRREGAIEATRGRSSFERVDYSDDPKFKETQEKPVWLSPVHFDGFDPFIAIAMAHSGRKAGSTVAEINLKFLSDFIDQGQTGTDTDAFVLGPEGRLLAHSDIGPGHLGADLSNLPQVKSMIKPRAEPVTLGQDPDGHAVLTGSAAIPRMNWYVFFEQPLSKALQPVYGLLYRTGWLLALAIMLAVLAGMLLAHHLVTPIRALQVGARQLEASDFGHRINVKTADEIEELADHFNRMADQLQGSYSRLEQKVADRTRDLAQSNSELKALEEIGRAVASSPTSTRCWPRSLPKR